LELPKQQYSRGTTAHPELSRIEFMIRLGDRFFLGIFIGSVFGLVVLTGRKAKRIRKISKHTVVKLCLLQINGKLVVTSFGMTSCSERVEIFRHAFT
jgi:hypothetical protein